MRSQRIEHYWAINTFNWSPCVCVCVCVCVLVTELCTTLCNLMDYIAQQSSWISKNMWKFYPWNSPSKNTGVGWHFLLQGIIWPRDQTQVSCITGRHFHLWATREALQDFKKTRLLRMRSWSMLRTNKVWTGLWLTGDFEIWNMAAREGVPVLVTSE